MNKTIPLMRGLSHRNSIKHYEQLWIDTRCNMNQKRFMKIIHPPPVSGVIIDKDVSKSMSRDSMAVLPDVMRDMTEISNNLHMPDVSKWLSKLFNYTLPGKRESRRLETTHFYKMLCPESELTDENLRLSYILGWCVEILFFLYNIYDDIMDHGIIREGEPCWYRQNDKGLMAINDGIILNMILYQLLQKNFKNKVCYVHLLEAFHDVSMKTYRGQSLEMLIQHSFKTKKFKNYTMDNYLAIAKYKASYPIIILPWYLAVGLANVNDIQVLSQVETFLIEMGRFFNVQDDFFDCYGDPNIQGTIGTDIAFGKCTWLAVVALQRANSHQRRIMEEHYGINDQSEVKIIKNLYEELKIPTAYEHYEKETFNLIYTQFQQISQYLPQEIFDKFILKNIRNGTFLL